MKCPFCQHTNTSVKDSRTTLNDENVRRRRACDNCHAKFSTIERPVLKELFVIKRSGFKKPFESQKIYSSVSAALRKRYANDEEIHKIVNRICMVLQSQQEKEIATRKIGDMILEELAKVDEVAYIRFASVYKDFATAKDFSQFINYIKTSKNKAT